MTIKYLEERIQEIMMTDYCDGCFSKHSHRKHGVLIQPCCNMGYNDKGQCPCTLCIVKMMCDSSCDDYFNYRLEKEKSDE